MSERAQKGAIVTIGRVTPEGQPRGWQFDNQGIPAINILEDGSILYAGWSVDELRDIAVQQPAAAAEDAR